MVESVEMKEERKKIWEGDCLHKRIVLSSNCDPKTKPASALAVASRRTGLRPQEARRMQKDTTTVRGRVRQELDLDSLRLRQLYLSRGVRIRKSISRIIYMFKTMAKESNFVENGAPV